MKTNPNPRLAAGFALSTGFAIALSVVGLLVAFEVGRFAELNSRFGVPILFAAAVAAGNFAERFGRELWGLDR
jgi:hypothetical protein